MPGTGFFRTLLQDVRFALRQLRRSPGFAITAIVTVALGIGANTAIFTIAHTVLMQRLPVHHPDQLVRIGDHDDCCMYGGMPPDQRYHIFSTEQYQVLRDATAADFQHGLAAVVAGPGNGTGLGKRAGTNDAAANMRGHYVSGNYFQALALQPAAGRLLLPDDDRLGSTPVAVMAYSTWTNQYQSDPTVVGSSFLLDSHPVTVVGVAPAGFYSERLRDESVSFYLPLATEPYFANTPIYKNPHLRWLFLVGRLEPGVSRTALQGVVDNTLRSYLLSQQNPADAPGGFDYRSAEGRKELAKVHAPLSSAATGIAQIQERTAEGIHILMGIAVLVLLIACANLANLMLARATTRRSEISIRVALGASQQRVTAQALTESVVIALLGGACGVALAVAGARAMLALAFPHAEGMPVSASPSLAVLGFAFAVAVVTGLLFGLAPAIASRRRQPAEAMRGLNRTAAGGASLFQRVLVVAQATLSLVLVAMAALLTRSLNNLQHQDLGLQVADRYVIHLDPIASGYSTAQLPGLIQRLRDTLQALPGTESVSFSNYSPLEENAWGEGVYPEGRPDPGMHDDYGAVWLRVSPDFFRTVGQPLLRGRDFSLSDRADTPQVAVVNQKFVKHFYPNEDPIGKRFGTSPHKFAFTIVGVVADAKYRDLNEEPPPMFFRSIVQINPDVDPRDMGETYSLAPHTILVHTTGAQAGYDGQLRRAFQQTDANLAITNLRPWQQQLSDLSNNERMIARLTAAFGILALVLASVGLYGLTSYTVAQRVPEIGVRMALGADRAGVLGLVLRGAMLQTLLGLALGVPAALFAGHALRAHLFGVGSHDLLTLFTACAVLAVSALLASLAPAYRASAVDPMRALRAE